MVRRETLTSGARQEVVGKSNLLKNIFNASTRTWSPASSDSPFCSRPVIFLILPRPVLPCPAPTVVPIYILQICFSSLNFTFNPHRISIALAISLVLKVFSFRFNCFQASGYPRFIIGTTQNHSAGYIDICTKLNVFCDTVSKTINIIPIGLTDVQATMQRFYGFMGPAFYCSGGDKHSFNNRSISRG